MAKFNPASFTRGPVTVIVTLFYVAILTILIVIQTTVPAAPKSPTPVRGINLTEAWSDLQHLTAQYHPYNSHANDDVRKWLLDRVHEISANHSSVHIFDDTTCNITSSVPGNNITRQGVTTYFESTNIIVYIRGKDDDKSKWWKTGDRPTKREAVLVNAHYDSVASGYGATDDGIGIISILQLLKYYLADGNQPDNGLVLLMNNGEEDFLNGARAFSQHPMSQVCGSFLNLEGAGAGGRATLFRGTDIGVTRAYGNVAHPFGTVVTGDGFERGLVASQTDYVVFNGAMGLRGLDVAFFEARARYHTASDSTRHTNMDSLWHMLEAAISTTKSLTSGVDESDDAGVWFDLFGMTFAVFQLSTLFALSVTVLVVAPIVLIITLVFLSRDDKMYLFSSSGKVHTPTGDDTVPLSGWRGLFRFPIILLFACAAPVALAYLLFKENTFIAHSSEWAVWSMMISSFFFVAWFVSRVAEYARPSSLTRAYGMTWFFVAWWVLLVGATVFETQLHVAGAYAVVFYFAAVFVATWTTYLELFSLPKKTEYCESTLDDSESTTARRPRDDTEAEPTERTGLLEGGPGRSSLRKYSRDEQHEDGHDRLEQEWSTSQWTWLWIPQFVLLAPINLILIGQIALVSIAAIHQTGPDGSSMFVVYLFMAVFTILLFSPVIPFIHRFTWHVPMFLLLVLIGTLIYNLIAFPFSSQNRLKIFFQQSIDLDTGLNNVIFAGVDPYVRDAVAYIPSAAGVYLEHSKVQRAGDVAQYSWPGIAPNVEAGKYKSWLTYNMTSLSAMSARFEVTSGMNSRACKLVFPLSHPIKSVSVKGASEPDERFPAIPNKGSREVRLWSRTWNRTWTADIGWSGKGGFDGKVVCLWSDVNQVGVIPAYDEAMHYVPEWVAITKAGDGLVEGWKQFVVS